MKCLCAAARRTARLLNHLYEKQLRLAGMTPAQFELLGTIAARPRTSHSVLAKAMDLDGTTLSRNVGLLLKRGWIARVTDAKDQRRMFYQLSEAGEAALRSALPLWEQAQSHVQQALGVEESAVWSTLTQFARISPR